MKKKLGLFALVLAAALFVNAGAQVTGKYLGFTATRYWDNNGVFSTDNVLVSQGASNTIKALYDSGNYATLIVSSAGVAAFDTTGTTGGFTFADPVTITGLITHKYDAAAYWTATQADAGGVTFNSVSDGTASFTFSDQINLNGALNYSGITPAGTAGSLITTGSTWVEFPTANACGIKVLLSNTSSTGEFASMRIRGRSNSATPTVAGNFSASAGQNDHGDLYAVQGYAQPNAYTNAAATYTVGLYSCIDRTAASIGYDWSTWIDTHMQVKASGSSYLLRLSHNGTVANDGAITIYNGGRMPVLFNFEDAAGFLTETGDAGSTKAGYIAVKTPAGTKYIQLVTA